MNHRDTDITSRPGADPSTTVTWPAGRHVRNQTQQIKGSAKPQAEAVLPTTQPSQPTVAPKTTPKSVSQVRVVSRAPVNGQKTLTVQFNHPPSDPYFAGVNIYLRRTGQQPTLVAGGAKSPVTLTVPTHAASHAIFVTSVGNWGETDVLTSPSHPVSLR